jgi:hypothetical protein
MNPTFMEAFCSFSIKIFIGPLTPTNRLPGIFKLQDSFGFLKVKKAVCTGVIVI